MKRKSKGAYMISAVAEMYGIHPQTLRLYEREGLIKPSGTASRIGNRMIMVLARMAEIVLVPV